MGNQYQLWRLFLSQFRVKLERSRLTLVEEFARCFPLTLYIRACKNIPFSSLSITEISICRKSSANNSAKNPIFESSHKQFQVARAILESTSDYSILADILKLSTDSDQSQILASVAETLNNHLQEFSAIGARDSCVKSLLEKYDYMKSQSQIDEHLIISLLDLCTRLPERVQRTKDLRKDLSKLRKATAVVACSPISVSDHVTDASPGGNTSFSDDIERALASGTNIDKPTLARLFSSIVNAIESTWKVAHGGSLEAYSYLMRLDVMDSDTSEHLIPDWLVKVLKSDSRPPLSSIIIPLFEFRCLSFSRLLTCFENLQSGSSSAVEFPRFGKLAYEIITFLSSHDSDNCNPLDTVSSPIFFN